MKIKLNKTQKIFAAFALVVVISFLVWGCKFTPTTKEVKTDTTELKADTLKIDTVGKK